MGFRTSSLVVLDTELSDDALDRYDAASRKESDGL